MPNEQAVTEALPAGSAEAVPTPAQMFEDNLEKRFSELHADAIASVVKVCVYDMIVHPNLSGWMLDLDRHFRNAPRALRESEVVRLVGQAAANQFEEHGWFAFLEDGFKLIIRSNAGALALIDSVTRNFEETCQKATKRLRSSTLSFPPSLRGLGGSSRLESHDLRDYRDPQSPVVVAMTKALSDLRVRVMENDQKLVSPGDQSIPTLDELPGLHQWYIEEHYAENIGSMVRTCVEKLKADPKNALNGWVVVEVPDYETKEAVDLAMKQLVGWYVVRYNGALRICTPETARAEVERLRSELTSLFALKGSKCPSSKVESFISDLRNAGIWGKFSSYADDYNEQSNTVCMIRVDLDELEDRLVDLILASRQTKDVEA